MRNWELLACGTLALFFGIASLVISISEPAFSARPFDTTLLLLGVVCLFISWLALESNVSAGRLCRGGRQVTILTTRPATSQR